MATQNLTPEEFDQEIAMAIKEIYGDTHIDAITDAEVAETVTKIIGNLAARGINADRDEILCHLIRTAISAYRLMQQVNM